MHSSIALLLNPWGRGQSNALVFFLNEQAATGAAFYGTCKVLKC